MSTSTVSDYEVTTAYIKQNIDAITEFARQYLNDNFFEDDDVIHAFNDRVDLNFVRSEDDAWDCYAYPVVNGDPDYSSEYEVHIKVDTDTYKIIRSYRDWDRDSKVILTGLTLQEAKAHCRRDDTHGDGWFDGYEKEA